MREVGGKPKGQREFLGDIECVEEGKRGWSEKKVV